jgi:hypothetical protein
MIKLSDNILLGFDTAWNRVNLWLSKKNRHELIVWTLLLGYLLIGYLIYDDYGISMDEPIQRKHGMVSLEYVNRKLGEPFNIPNIYNIDMQYYDHRDYGVIFQMGCYALELFLGLKDSRDIFLLRHALVFLLFWVSVVYFYKLLKYHFKDWRLALLGAIFLILSPRIFANAFYNPKDIPLLSWCIISTYTMLKFLDLRNINYAFLHAFVCAMAINTRIVGLYIPILTICIFVIDILKEGNKTFQLGQNLKALFLFTLSCSAFTISFWPFLWSDPINHLIYSFTSMSHFRWYNFIFFMGELVDSEDLPSYYLPIWIGISTPLIYLLFFIIGVAIIIKDLIKSRFNIYNNASKRNRLIFLLLFFIPILSVIFLKSVLYNGWRHLYFIYPPMIFIAIHGIKIISSVRQKQ